MQHYAALINSSHSGLGVEMQRLINIFLPGFQIDATVNKPRQVSEIAAIVVALLICFAMPNSQQIALWFVARRVHAILALQIVTLVVIVAALSFALVSPESNNAFIYFEF